MIKKCEKYDIFNDKWEEIPELNHARQNLALAVFNQRHLYAFCGYDGFKNLNVIERLDVMNEQEGIYLFLYFIN